MPIGAAHKTIMKAGTCPHGLPLGACPICNGMTGGNSTSKRDTPRNAGEMTYNQCLAIGMMLKAQKKAKEQAKLSQMQHTNALAEFAKNINKTHQRILEFNALITDKLPKIISKPINFIINTIIINTLKFVQNTTQTISNIIQSVSQKFTHITEKLTAIFGELKSAINEKVSKFFTSVKKKFKSLFSVFSSSETDDEEKKIEEAKRTFELKTFIQKLLQRKNKQNKDNKNEH